MSREKVLLLPGMDGTGDLLEDFAAAAPSHIDVSILPLPDDPNMDYAALVEFFTPQVEAVGPCTLLGESFSGPLSVMLAHRLPRVVNHLVLVATFIKSPAPWIARMVPWSLVFRLPLPRWIASYLLTGGNNALTDELLVAIRAHQPKTLAKRLRCVMDVDVSYELHELSCPITFLAGLEDRLIPNRCVWVKEQSNSRRSLVGVGAPHLLLQSQPDIAWQAITCEETSDR